MKKIRQNVHEINEQMLTFCKGKIQHIPKGIYYLLYTTAGLLKYNQ